MNSSYPFAEVLKARISNFNLTMLENANEIFYRYLLKLNNASKQLLYFHRGHTFILVFVSIAKYITITAKELLDRKENLFKYVLSYKFSQDHIELLFSCIRSRGGFNNNSNIIQFRT